MGVYSPRTSEARQWLDVLLMFLAQGACALVCLWGAKRSLRIAPRERWLRVLKPLAILLPVLIAILALKLGKQLVTWLALSPMILLAGSICLGWSYWRVPRSERSPIAPELKLLGSAALAGASLEPVRGIIFYLSGHPGDGAFGNWVYILFIPIWAAFSLIPGLAIALFAWTHDWKDEGDARWN